jgi:hypothetical protein
MSVTSRATEECQDLCLHEIEFIPQHSDDDFNHTCTYNDCDDAFCNFVCQFISLDCPKMVKCVEQPCANYALCGNMAPQWLLDTRGGLCMQPCDMFYGRQFEFSSFAADEACPVCLDTGRVSLVYACGHMICARCYRKAGFSEAATDTLKKCPICRRESQLRTQAVMHPNWFE